METTTTETTTTVVSFDTELGRCAVRWTERGIASVRLPSEKGRPEPPVEAALDVPDFVLVAIAGMQAAMAGSAADLRDVPIDDHEVDAFRRAVYAATREIPAGTTQTYGEIARAMSLSHPEAAREVGAALARNPTPIVVPCHRVVGANGKLTGFSAPGGLATKRRMLELEGAPGYGQQMLFGS